MAQGVRFDRGLAGTRGRLLQGFLRRFEARARVWLVSLQTLVETEGPTVNIEMPRVVAALPPRTRRRLGRLLFRGARFSGKCDMRELAIYFYWVAGNASYRPARSFRQASLHARRLRRPTVRVYRGCLVEDDVSPGLLVSYFERLAHDEKPSGANALRIARSLEAAGQLEWAKPYFAAAAKSSPMQPDYWFHLGMSHVVRSTANGGFTPEASDQAEECFYRALTLDPGHSNARAQLVRLLVRRQDWPRIACLPGGYEASTSSARGAAGVSPRANGRPAVSADEELSALLGLLSSEAPPSREWLKTVLDQPSWALVTGVPPHLWFPLHWRLLSLHWFSEAYLLKGLWAESLSLQRGRVRVPPLAESLLRAQANVFLERLDTAEEIVSSLAAGAKRAGQERFLHGFSADIDLRRGSLERHAEDSLLAPGALVSSSVESDFRSLISSRRVAIVGPAPDSPPLGAEIDGFDVVVRTRLPDPDHFDGDRFGSRTDIVYPALGRSLFVAEQLACALEEERIRFVVLRTAGLKSWASFNLLDRGVRLNPREYAASFAAAQFGVQRIVHDLLRYRPAELKVFAATLFLGSGPTHYDGYGSDIVSGRGERGLIRPPDSFAHDHASDFRFLDCLVRGGLVHVDAALASILDLGLAGYLSSLDEQFRANIRPSPVD